MNIRISALAVALALLVVAPTAFAQRASLAERVSTLEQRASADQGNVDLLNQVTALKSEVQALRAQIEELQHQQQQSQESARNQYLDLDGRINRLEGGAPVAAPPVVDATSAAPATAPPRKPVVAVRESAPAPAVVVGDAERVAYGTAFDVLKAGRYDESARQFQAFLAEYPAGPLAPNALYWLGESYYATQNYELAQQQFQALLDRYPTHDKAPGALLKLGLSQYGLARQDQAEATLAQVVERYPGTDAARTAQDRLRAMQLSALR